MPPWYRIIRTDIQKGNRKFPQEIIDIEDISEGTSTFCNGGISIPIYTEGSRIVLNLHHSCENGGNVVFGVNLDGLDLIKKAKENKSNLTLWVDEGQAAIRVKFNEQDETHSVEYHTVRPIEFENIRIGGSKEVK